MVVLAMEYSMMKLAEGVGGGVLLLGSVLVGGLQEIPQDLPIIIILHVSKA
jgi:hypothetical protein